MNGVKTRILAVICAFGLLYGCEPRPVSELSPEDGIQRIRENHSKERWELVTQEVNEYRSRYPYSQYASEAELLLADAYFQSEKYPEAISVYEEFLRKNVTHTQRPLAVYRIARSYDLQSPEEIDREQGFSAKALEKYSTYLEAFPQGDKSGQSKERIQILKRRLAEHELFVARFYWKKDLYHSALNRYLNLLSQYPYYEDIKKEAKERAIKAYTKLADELEKHPDSDAVIFYRGSNPSTLRRKAEELAHQN